MSFRDNITMRRPKNNLNMSDSIIFDSKNNYSHSSLPNTSKCDTSILIDFKAQVDKMHTELNTANEEICKLSLEISDLRRSNELYRKKIDMYKTVTVSDVLKHKHSQKINTRMSCIPTYRQIDRLCHLKTTTTQRSSSVCRVLEQLYSPTKSDDGKATSSLLRDDANDTIIFSSPQERSMSASTPKHGDQQKSSRVHLTPDKVSRNINATSPPKLCIVSSNNSNSVLKVAKRNFRNHDICHYITTHGGVEQLLEGIDTKLQGFTKRDYCLLLIGNKDFLTTNNYEKCINLLREKLQHMNHTNIVIGSPTFSLKKYCYLYNRRIEAFNNLLYKDNQINRYAYLLDTNKNLQYSFNMFSKKTGNINNKSLSIIFEDFVNLLCCLQCDNVSIARSKSVDKTIAQNKSHDFLDLTQG